MTQLTPVFMSGFVPIIAHNSQALVGSTAMMAGATRLTMSLCVIVVELTESRSFLFVC